LFVFSFDTLLEASKGVQYREASQLFWLFRDLNIAPSVSGPLSMDQDEVKRSWQCVGISISFSKAHAS
jgi:hypothetical protein